MVTMAVVLPAAPMASVGQSEVRVPSSDDLASQVHGLGQDGVLDNVALSSLGFSELCSFGFFAFSECPCCLI